MNRFLISTASGLALLAGAAHAQEATTDTDDATVLEAINVTANRTPTEMSKTGSKVEIVTQQEIEEKSLPSVSDYLNRLPGISVASDGGIGSTTGVFVRGLPVRYLKTLYNGIDVADMTTPQVQPAFEYLQTAGVSSIEVLKGSQSTLYGSDAIAGVVDISSFTDLGPGIHHIVEVEGGSFGTVRGRYGINAANETSRIAGNIFGYRTDGISAAAGGTERDGYENVTVDLNVEHRINEAFSVFGSGLYINSEAEYDWPPADTDDKNKAKMLGGRVGFNLDLLDGRWRNTVAIQGFKMDREIVAFNIPYSGTRHKIDYKGAFEVSDRISLQYGLDHERQKATELGSGPTSVSHALTGVWVQGIVEPVDDLVITAGLRHDAHSEFGGHLTYRGTASYLVRSSGTRLHSSIGTGFRAPSLYELHDPWVSNPDLKPETSKSFDIGIEQNFLDGRLKADVTYFNLAIDNVIDYLWWLGALSYQQIEGTTRSQGVEASFTYRATDWLDLGGSYTYMDSRVPDGTRAPLRPRHMMTLAASARPAEKWTVSGDVKFVADTIDGSVALGNYALLKDYVLLNAKVAYQVNDLTEVYLRGENLLNQKYQVSNGYNTPGIAAYAGFRAKF